jgi:hypothetical protein
MEVFEAPKPNDAWTDCPLAGASDAVLIQAVTRYSRIAIWAFSLWGFADLLFAIYRAGFARGRLVYPDTRRSTVALDPRAGVRKPAAYFPVRYFHGARGALTADGPSGERASLPVARVTRGVALPGSAFSCSNVSCIQVCSPEEIASEWQTRIGITGRLAVRSLRLPR